MSPRERGARRAAFLDRDGTLIVERGYLADPEGVELIPGAAESLRVLHGAGFALVVVTNQSGIARGLYGIDEFRAVQRRVEELFAAEGVIFDAVHFCPHHPEVSGPCECRKPGVGMYRRAARELGIALEDSIFVGDKVADVLPAIELGGDGYLVRTGYGVEHASDVPPGIAVVDDVAAAAAMALGRNPGEEVGLTAHPRGSTLA
jgi:D-glycero-D-manno-heptose 1,7-bisphosphate phosphatase